MAGTPADQADSKATPGSASVSDGKAARDSKSEPADKPASGAASGTADKPEDKSAPVGKPGTDGKASTADESDDKATPASKSAPAEKSNRAVPGDKSAPARTPEGKAAPASESKPADKPEGNTTPDAKPGATDKADSKSSPADQPDSKPGSADKADSKSTAADKPDGKATPADKPGSAGKPDSKATPASDSAPADKSNQAAPSDKLAPARTPEGKTAPTSKSKPADKADGKSTPADKPDPKPGAADRLIPTPQPAPDDKPTTKPTPTDQPTTTLRAPKSPKSTKGGGDQPTTTLRAPNPAKKRDVDQPTTMLKIGGKAKEPEAEVEAERTSRFVALKGDIRTAPAEETRTVPVVGPERTTQQPLPPKPPLDLLAELTNTPPPPETPVRTLVRRVKIWTPLVLLLIVILGVVQAVRPLPQPTLDLTAKDTYTFEGGKADIPWPAGGQAALDVQGIGSFGSSGSDKPVPTASVAKVMTAYLILHDHPLKSGEDGPKIKIDKTAESQSNAGQESTVNVTAGDEITQREALEDILLASANNIARLVARWDAGSVDAFVAKMNTTAKGLGMSNTKYTDPSGLTDSTVSTARDQVKLAKAAMAYPAFREVAAMMSYTDYKGTYHSNWNQLVGHNNVVGIKTGTTTSALGNLVFAAKKDVDGQTRLIIGAAMRQPPAKSDNSILTGVLNAGDALIRAAQGALKSATVLRKGTVVGYVDDGLGGRTPVEVTEDVKAIGWAGLKVKLSFAGGTVPHTAKAGTKVGTLTVGDGSVGAVQVPVALRDDLAEPGLGSKLTRLG
ncbi:D-alanyl-D-alanine carboxypeptidase [Streptomyces sp. NPDC059575]|uniref:D-alanyl-D-alanine carboxypeptidase n=1 Tax=Streptomyces sp. NPDC059575 TaxID=3346872 RepID=UPI0036C54234